MKLTKDQLRKIIKEELDSVLESATYNTLKSSNVSDEPINPHDPHGQHKYRKPGSGREERPDGLPGNKLSLTEDEQEDITEMNDIPYHERHDVGVDKSDKEYAEEAEARDIRNKMGSHPSQDDIDDLLRRVDQSVARHASFPDDGFPDDEQSPRPRAATHPADLPW